MEITQLAREESIFNPSKTPCKELQTQPKFQCWNIGLFCSLKEKHDAHKIYVQIWIFSDGKAED